MNYATCRRCGAQLTQPTLGQKIECPSCQVVYSVKTRLQASDGAPHCALCGADVDDTALSIQVRFGVLGERLLPLGRWVCSKCRRPSSARLPQPRPLERTWPRHPLRAFSSEAIVSISKEPLAPLD
jgi:DNA-directed RNA polymerase subunit RPC12/RpoP